MNTHAQGSLVLATTAGRGPETAMAVASTPTTTFVIYEDSPRLYVVKAYECGSWRQSTFPCSEAWWFADLSSARLAIAEAKPASTNFGRDSGDGDNIVESWF